jgi:hypothetical protein
VTEIAARLKLVDVKTGVVLWESTAFASKNSGDGGEGKLDIEIDF